MNSPDPSAIATNRRDFGQRIAALALGGLITVAPLAVGLATFFDALRRKSALGGFVRVARLDSLPADGVPRRFPVVARRVDAWNHFPPEPIGLVYLRRTGEATVEAVNAACPHAGCAVDFQVTAEGRAGRYQCPCHDSHFDLDGELAGADNPAPRRLDRLEIDEEKLRQGEIWVRYQEFIAGKTEQVVSA